MTIREYMQDGDREAAEEIKREYDYRFDQVMELYALRDTLIDTRRSTVDVCRQIADHQTRMRWLDEKLHVICMLPSHPYYLNGMIPQMVKKPDAIWTSDEGEKGVDIPIYHQCITKTIHVEKVYVPRTKAYGIPRPGRKRKPRPDIQAIANGILNIETE